MFVLALAGLFISVTLLISHIFILELPCGGRNDCRAVAASELSHVGPIPIAAFGALFDAAVIGICLLRPGKTGQFWRTSAAFVWTIGLIATVISAYLTNVSVHNLGAFCIWCVSHAIVVALIWLISAIEISKFAPDPGEVPAKSGERKLFVPVLALALIASASYGTFLYKTASIYRWFPQKYNEAIIGDGHWSLGPASAPVTIVEFGDLECDRCPPASIFLNKFQADHSKTVRIIFRHRILPMHPHAQDLAEIAEWAGTKGKFWEMHDAIYADQKPGSEGKYLTYATRIGLDDKELQKFLDTPRTDKKGIRYKAFMQTYDDWQDAAVLGVDQTPTLYVIVNPPGGERHTYKAASLGGLKRLVEDEQVEKWIGPATAENRVKGATK